MVMRRPMRSGGGGFFDRAVRLRYDRSAGVGRGHHLRSGTTGAPKGIVQSYRARAEACAYISKFGVG